MPAKKKAPKKAPKKDSSAIKGTPVTSEDLRKHGIENYGDEIEKPKKKEPKEEGSEEEAKE